MLIVIDQKEVEWLGTGILQREQRLVGRYQLLGLLGKLVQKSLNPIQNSKVLRSKQIYGYEINLIPEH